MHAIESDMDIENRLRRLERRNRCLLILLALIVGYEATSYVNAGEHPQRIIADSVQTHSLSVVNPYGKQAVTIEVGDTGMVSLGVSDAEGQETIGLLSTPSGEPSICLAYGGKCRIVIGEVYRGNQPELSMQLRDKNGHSIWMPETANAFSPSTSR